MAAARPVLGSAHNRPRRRQMVGKPKSASKAKEGPPRGPRRRFLWLSRGFVPLKSLPHDGDHTLPLRLSQR
jgi:hypothetical protein